MSNLEVTYDGVQHCTAYQAAIRKSVSSDGCTATGGKGEELSPGELVGTGLASCMLFTMGMLALRDELDIQGTRVEVDVSTREDMARIERIELAFHMPREFSDVDRLKLERAAGTCPIKHSFHPDIQVATRFEYPHHAGIS
jgi:uncharacterized OsmC-like protein